MKTKVWDARSAKALRSCSGRTSPAVITALAAEVRRVDRRGTPRSGLRTSIGVRSRGTTP